MNSNRDNNHIRSTMRPFRSATILVMIMIVAAATLVTLGGWLALIDSFSRFQGEEPSGIATLLGSLWLGTGTTTILLTRRLRNKVDFASGVTCGAAGIVVIASALVGAWLGVFLAGIVATTVLALRWDQPVKIRPISQRSPDHHRAAA
jgi:ABC-type antimicrobial peptide transport system permease subunit